MCIKINPVCDVIEIIGHVGGSVATSVFSSVASAFGNTADSAINWLWRQLSSSTTVSLGGANFELDLGIVVSIAVVLCLGLFVIQMAVSALRRDAGGVGRALRGLVIATIGCAITLASLNVLLLGVDQLCVGIVKVATGGTIATLGTKIIGGAIFTTAVTSPATILILSLFAIVAVAIVWFSLVIRKMLIIITAVFAPIAFAGGVADLSRGWVRKWLEAMLALVISKLILIIIFVIGLGVLGGMGSATGGTPLTSITGEITGLLILLVAGFSPWMALRLVHFTGDHVATMAQSASHASAGASTVVGAPQKAAQMKYSAMMLGGHRSGSVAPPPGSELGPIGGDVASSARAGTSGAGAAGVVGGGVVAGAAKAGDGVRRVVSGAAKNGVASGATIGEATGSGASGSPVVASAAGLSRTGQDPTSRSPGSSITPATPSPKSRNFDAPVSSASSSQAPPPPAPPRAAVDPSSPPQPPPPPFRVAPPEPPRE
jgi:type IV secretion system protein TrbL